MGFVIALVGGAGCYAGSSESGESFANNANALTGGAKIAISPAMVVAESASAANFTAIADEQALAGDPRAGSGGNPITTWTTAFNNALYPMSVYLDLGQEYDLTDIYLYDANNTTGVTVSTGTPGSWTTLYTQALDQYKTWRGKTVTVKTRYVRFTKPAATTNFSEVVLYGTPASGGGGGGGSTPIACTTKAQGGACDFIVTPPQGSASSIVTTTFDAAVSGVQAGQRVCLTGGNYPYSRLKLLNITGAQSSYVTVSNCGGKFTIGNATDTSGDGVPDASRGIEIQGSKYFYLSGTGSTDAYGIKIAGTSSGLSGLSIGDLSTDYEVEHVEVQEAGFAGVMAKTEPGCSDTNPTSFRGGFVQRNTHFHDNYIHDSGGEGYYIGYSFPNGHDMTCNGVTTTVYGHPVDNVKIYNNVFERTGCEAIQFGMTQNADVHDNYIVGYGVSPFANYQNNGIQVGGKSGGKVYENLVVNPDPAFAVGNGIIIAGSGDTLIYSNTIVNAMHGMYIHQDASPGKTVSIINNTIVNPTGDASASKQGIGIWSFNTGATIRLTNNLIVLGPQIDTSMPESSLPLVYGILDQKQPWAAQQQGTLGANITATSNLALPKSQGNVFVNAAAYDFTVQSAAARNKGVDVSSFGVTSAMLVDQASRSVSSAARKQGTATDIGAFEAP